MKSANTLCRSLECTALGRIKIVEGGPHLFGGNFKLGHGGDGQTVPLGRVTHNGLITLMTDVSKNRANRVNNRCVKAWLKGKPVLKGSMKVDLPAVEVKHHDGVVPASVAASKAWIKGTIVV